MVVYKAGIMQMALAFKNVIYNCYNYNDVCNRFNLVPTQWQIAICKGQ